MDVFAGLFVIAISGVVIATFVVWIWALIDAIRVPDDAMFRAGDKLIWVLVIVFTQIIGAILYLAIGRPRSTA